MKPYFNDQRSPSSNVVASLFQTDTSFQKPTRFVAYNLNDQQSVLIGHTYVVKVDSILRCPVFETGETRVYDIDNVLSSYYDCSDSESDSDSDSELEFDIETEAGRVRVLSPSETPPPPLGSTCRRVGGNLTAQDRQD
jgi:hypothetical protein